MTEQTCTTAELDHIGGAEELRIASRRADGMPRPRLPIWVVRLGDGPFVRFWPGTDGPVS